MQRFKNILLVAGGAGWEASTHKRAVELAKNNRARLTVVDVVEELSLDMRVLATSISPADLQKLAVSDRLKELRRHIEPILNKGVQVTAKVLAGIPFLGIIRDVLRNKNDLVMKTAR